MYSNWTVEWYFKGKLIVESFEQQLSWPGLQMYFGICKRDNYIGKYDRGSFDAVTIYEWERGKKTLIRELQEV